MINNAETLAEMDFPAEDRPENVHEEPIKTGVPESPDDKVMKHRPLHVLDSDPINQINQENQELN